MHSQKHPLWSTRSSFGSLMCADLPGWQEMLSHHEEQVQNEGNCTGCMHRVTLDSIQLHCGGFGVSSCLHINLSDVTAWLCRRSCQRYKQR